jgi:hypothetical protein
MGIPRRDATARGPAARAVEPIGTVRHPVAGRRRCAVQGGLVELGSVAELLSAFGTLAALVAASVAAWAAIRTSDQQGRQLRRLEEAERRRQAELEQRDAARIAFWTGVNSDGPAVWYVNSSDLPVYNLRLAVVIPGWSTDLVYTSLGPTQSERPLKRVRSALLAHRDVEERTWVEHLEHGAFRCAAVFRDPSNRWWFRDYSGALSRQDDERAAVEALERHRDRLRGGPDDGA